MSFSDRQTQQSQAEAARLHAFYRGKLQTAAKCALGNFDGFSTYTPGVAAPYQRICADPQVVFEYTNKGNTIAVVSHGSRVLGLGDIGPEAGLPAMEGKALLFQVPWRHRRSSAVPLARKTIQTAREEIFVFDATRGDPNAS